MTEIKYFDKNSMLSPEQAEFIKKMLEAQEAERSRPHPTLKEYFTIPAADRRAIVNFFRRNPK